MTLEKLRHDWDWGEAFAYAGEKLDACDGQPHRPQVVINGDCSDAPFSRADVIRIVASSDGEYDGPDWIGIFKLKDGRYGFLAAGCDYTGWD